jgi:hypothetical protein
MRRTSLYLDNATLDAAQRAAKHRGVPFAQVVREALAEYVAKPRAPGLPSVAGQFASGDADTSERVDELLWRDPHR